MIRFAFKKKGMGSVLFYSRNLKHRQDFLYRIARKVPSFRVGMNSADGSAVF